MLRKMINIENLIHSFKTLIACCIGIMLTYIISFPSDQWVIITIIVVMCSQLYVGSVMQKSYLRFIGTLFGCLLAILALVTLGDNRLAAAAAVGLSSFIFSYISIKNENLSYACTLGAVTTAIIMLGQTPTITFAAERFLEISVGLLIATVVSQFILPINARDHLRRAQITTLEQMRDYYKTSLKQASESVAKFNYLEMDEEIVKNLLKQRQLAKESKREPLGTEFSHARFLQTIYSEKEMLRAITFMHVALRHILEFSPNFAKTSAMESFNGTTIAAFDTLVSALDYNKPKSYIIIPQVSPLTVECEKNLYSGENLLYMEGFLFCAQLLSDSLAKLGTLTGCLSEKQ